MAKPYGKVVAHCNKCSAGIGDQHVNTWCVECGEPFDKETIEQVPALAAMAARSSEPPVAPRPSPVGTEGAMATGIGAAVIWVSILSTIICIFAFGRVEISGTAYWAPGFVIAFIASGMSGVLFGYLLSTVGRTLTIVEALAAKLNG